MGSGALPQWEWDAACEAIGRPRAVRLIYTGGGLASGRVETLDETGVSDGGRTIDELIAAMPCFTRGTQIATARGVVPVEAVRPGDRVVTRDNGLQPVVWTGSERLGWRTLGTMPFLAPVRIRSGALGDSLPLGDLVLSPNHRVLVRTMVGSAREEALLAARSLVGRPGIEVEQRHEIEYWHLLLPGHEVIHSDGIWTESLAPAPATLATLAPAARAEIAALLPSGAPDDVRPEAV